MDPDELAPDDHSGGLDRGFAAPDDIDPDHTPDPDYREGVNGAVPTVDS